MPTNTDIKQPFLFSDKSLKKLKLLLNYSDLESFLEIRSEEFYNLFLEQKKELEKFVGKPIKVIDSNGAELYVTYANIIMEDFGYNGSTELEDLYVIRIIGMLKESDGSMSPTMDTYLGLKLPLTIFPAIGIE